MAAPALWMPSRLAIAKPAKSSSKPRREKTKHRNEPAFRSASSASAATSATRNRSRACFPSTTLTERVPLPRSNSVLHRSWLSLPHESPSSQPEILACFPTLGTLAPYPRPNLFSSRLSTPAQSPICIANLDGIHNAGAGIRGNDEAVHQHEDRFGKVQFPRVRGPRLHFRPQLRPASTPLLH